MEPIELRTLDAIHLACALALDADLAGVLTYDHRMADASRCTSGASLVAGPRSRAVGVSVPAAVMVSSLRMASCS
jgi:hypothetical protein